MVISSLESVPKTFYHSRRGMYERVWMNVILIITVKNSDVLKCKSAIEPLDDLMFET